MSDITERLTEYLVHGGLYNSELMQHNKVRDLLIDCRAEIARLREERRWVSVRERLPEEGVFVLCLEQDEYWPYSIGKRVGKFVNWGGDFDADVGRYTHWMPLPPDPKEG